MFVRRMNRARHVVFQVKRTGTICKRSYHDDSFGYQKARKIIIPDCTCLLILCSGFAPIPHCHPDHHYALRGTHNLSNHPDTPAQLHNRATNAPLLRYVDSMRTHGHRAASIDPLDLLHREEIGALNPTRYGLTDSTKSYQINGILWTNPTGSNTTSDENWPLSQIVNLLRSVYVGRIAYEFMHSPSKTERQWFANALESANAREANANTSAGPSPQQKKRIWELTSRSEIFDRFLQVKFPNLKRYGLEGGESMLPALDSLFSAASEGQSNIAKSITS